EVPWEVLNDRRIPISGQSHACVASAPRQPSSSPHPKTLHNFRRPREGGDPWTLNSWNQGPWVNQSVAVVKHFRMRGSDGEEVRADDNGWQLVATTAARRSGRPLASANNRHLRRARRPTFVVPAKAGSALQRTNVRSSIDVNPLNA